MTGFWFTALSFVVAIGVLVTVHEFGHFWVARRMGVKVLRFSVGFGHPLWRRQAADGTEYVVAAVPLGGYVKMLDEREGPVPAEELARAFNRKPLLSRVAIVAAGPAFNFLFAVLAYWLIFVIGVSGFRPVVGMVAEASVAAQAGVRSGDEVLSIDGRRTPTWESVRTILLSEALAGADVVLEVESGEGRRHLVPLPLSRFSARPEEGDLLARVGVTPWRPSIPPVIGSLTAGARAQAAGLRTGDRVLRADGESIPDWGAWVEYVRARPETPIQVTVTRGGRTVDLTVVPAAVEDQGQPIGRIGAAVEMPDPSVMNEHRAVLSYPPLRALGEAAARTWSMTALTVRVLWRLITGNASLENISGPITIAQYAGQTASIGLVPFLAFLAIVSISLGILNLLPVPVLDGGHLLYYLIELVKGSPLSEAAQMAGQRIGLVLLLGLMFLAFYNDITRLLG